MYQPICLFAEQQMIEFSSMYWIMLVSRILHILGAIILVGGLFYMRFVVSSVDAPPDASPVDRFFGGRRAIWAKLVGLATALLLITGVWNYAQISKQFDVVTSYHMVAGLKILAAIVVFLLAALLAGRTSAAEALREKWRVWLNVCLAVACLTVVFGSVLRSFPHREKDKTNPPPATKVIASSNAPGQ